MPYEVISAVLGSTLTELTSKLLPSRKTGGSPSDFMKTFERNYRWLYRGLMVSFFLGLFVPFFILPPEADGRLQVPNAPSAAIWSLGAILGLPFFMAFLFVIGTHFALGKQRAMDLIRYHELKQKTHIYVDFLLTGIFAPIGLASLIVLCRIRLLIG